MNAKPAEGEWPHRVRVLDLERPETHELNATSAQCDAVAVRLDVPAIAALSARITVTPETHLGRYVVTGTALARLTRQCVRTGVLFETEQTAEIEGYYGDKKEIVSFAQAKKKRAESEGDQPNFVDESEDPEPLDDGGIDLGELAVQSLSLALNPYPVSPDAPPPVEPLEGEKVRVENPFAILGQLREFMDED